MQKTGVEGEHLILLLEDHQLLEPTYLELVNSLLSSQISQKSLLALFSTCGSNSSHQENFL